MTLNMDPQEVAKFEALAERWWDPNSEFGLLHAINPVRLEYIRKACGGFTGKNILDIGTGGGILAESIAREGARVTGIDLAPAPLAVAELHAKETGLNIDYQKISAEEFADAHEETFDCVACMELLEHVPDPASTVAACARLVKPGGHVFFATLNRTFKSYALAIVAAEHLLRLLPRGTHSYEKLIRPSELVDWCDDAGLVAKDLSGMFYNPLFKRAHLIKDVNVNYLGYFQRPKQDGSVK